MMICNNNIVKVIRLLEGISSLYSRATYMYCLLSFFVGAAYIGVSSIVWKTQ